MNSPEAQQLFGYASVLAGIVSSGSYMLTTLTGKTKPHFFTTIAWVVPSFIVFLAQFLNGAGPGSWAMACTFFFCALTSIMAWKYRQQYIVKSDYLFLALSALAIVLWIVTKNALLSVILCAAIDIIGFVPTIRKSWHDPLSENLMSYAVTVLKHILSLFALSAMNFITAFFPLVMIVLNSGFCIYLLCRRGKLETIKI